MGDSVLEQEKPFREKGEKQYEQMHEIFEHLKAHIEAKDKGKASNDVDALERAKREFMKGLPQVLRVDFLCWYVRLRRVNDLLLSLRSRLNDEEIPWEELGYGELGTALMRLDDYLQLKNLGMDHDCQ